MEKIGQGGFGEVKIPFSNIYLFKTFEKFMKQNF